MYPRPPAIARVAARVRIVFAGLEIAATDAAWRVMETTHPPSYYLPRGSFSQCELVRAAGGSLCEWKGRAEYWTVRAAGRTAERSGWSYPAPPAPYDVIADHLAVYAGMMDACFVGEEQVTPQPGGFYGGWITRDLTGPFKGAPGSMGW